METNAVLSLIKLIIALPLVLVLAYASLKYASKQVNKLGDGKYIKLLETVGVSGKSSVSMVKIGTQYHILGVSDGGIETIKVLSDTEAKEYEDDIQRKAMSTEMYANQVLDRFKLKGKLRKNA